MGVAFENLLAATQNKLIDIIGIIEPAFGPNLKDAPINFKIMAASDQNEWIKQVLTRGNLKSVSVHGSKVLARVHVVSVPGVGLRAISDTKEQTSTSMASHVRYELC